MKLEKKHFSCFAVKFFARKNFFSCGEIKTKYVCKTCWRKSLRQIRNPEGTGHRSVT